MSEQEIPAIEDLEVLTRLWYNNHAAQLGDTVITVQSKLIGTYQISIKNISLLTAEEALGVMENEISESNSANKKVH